MFAAGADLIQVYTGLIYRGPGLVRELVRPTAGRKRRDTAPQSAINLPDRGIFAALAVPLRA